MQILNKPFGNRAVRLKQALFVRHGGDRKSSGASGPLENPAGRSEDIAAEAIGMSRKTYQRTKAVVDSGNHEVIEQMDSGEKSIKARPYSKNGGR